MNSLRAVIFDLDGTLIDSAPDICASANILLEQNELVPLTLGQIHSFIGNGVPKLIERILRHVHKPLSLQEKWVQDFLKVYEENLSVHTKIFDGVEEVLYHLSARGVKLAICTNKPKKATDLILKHLNLSHYFEVVISGDCADEKKPSAAPLLKALEGIGVERAHALFIGDSVIDARAAQNADMAFGYYSSGYHHNGGAPVHFNFEFRHYQELDDCLRKVWRRH